jgi:hypothetical protein
MNMQSAFKQGNCSLKVVMLLERVQFADPGSSEFDEDNLGQSWGHYQFTAGGISPNSVLTTWQDFGSVANAFKLVAATLKTCQDARAMCTKAGMLETSGFISDVYLDQILTHLKECWVGAGRVRIDLTLQFCFINHLSRPLLLHELNHTATTTPEGLTQNKPAVNEPAATISEPMQEVQESSEVSQLLKVHPGLIVTSSSLCSPCL